MRKLRLVLAAVFVLLMLFSCASAENLRVAFNYNTAPYHFVGDDYTYVGLHIDMMNWIAREKGLEVVYVPYDSSGACLRALRSNEVDMILGHRTQDISAAGLLYTDELSTSSLSLVVNAQKRALIESGALSRTNAVTEFGITRSVYMDKLNIQGFMSMGSQKKVFEALEAGKSDLALMISDSYDYHVRKADAKDRYSVLLSYVSPVSHAILLREDQTELSNMLNQALASLRAGGQYQEIYRKWIVTDNGGLDYETIRRVNYIIAGGLALASLITAVVIAMNRYLRHRHLRHHRHQTAADSASSSIPFEIPPIYIRLLRAVNPLCIVNRNCTGSAYAVKLLQRARYIRSNNAHGAHSRSRTCALPITNRPRFQLRHVCRSGALCALAVFPAVIKGV